MKRRRRWCQRTTSGWSVALAEIVQVIDTPEATHIRYRVRR
jgi:hypothetical protein